MSSFTRALYRDKFMSAFDSLVFDSTEDVYDCTIDEVHRFSANGIIVHNCGEILLDTYQTCNLTTVNLCQFVMKKDATNDNENLGPVYLDRQGLMNAQRLSVRAGMRMTLVTLELPNWDVKQKRDRLVGTSLTGIQDALQQLGYTQEQEHELIRELGQVAREEATRYAKEIRIQVPLLTTTIKPEGTLSQVAGGVSQGLHFSHSPYFIRRVRISADDPMVTAIKKANWILHPETGTKGATLEEKMANARTYVVDFPVWSHATKTKDQTTIDEQLGTYYTYQKLYADHNCSNTITVKADEWERLPKMIHDHWDEYLGITFIPLDGGHYELMPYEECTKEVYEELKSKMSSIDFNLLKELDQKVFGNLNETDETITIFADESLKPECANGICPVR
jgi:ribonucleoside-diphosphate reductase alpha chain/ribonucleoside-triphosphate reductase